MGHFFATLLTCVAAFLPSLAIASPADKVDEYVAGEMRKQHIPGLALGVYRDGQIVNPALMNEGSA